LPDDSRFKPAELKGLPVKTFFSNDNKLAVLKNSMQISTLSNMRLPYVVLADRNGNVLFISTGYKIGIGEQILKYML